jgi:hypothetical protein
MKHTFRFTVLTLIIMACVACAIVSEKDNPLDVLNKALQAQKEAKSYRAHLTISYPDGKAVATLEYVNPNLYHIVDGSEEYVLIGEVVYRRWSAVSPNWERVSVSSGRAKLLAFSFFRPAEKHLKEDIRFVGKEVFNGQQCLVYEDIKEHSKIWISPVDALPRKVEDEYRAGGEVAVNTWTVIYSDYNSDIKIEPPQ